MSRMLKAVGLALVAVAAMSAIAAQAASAHSFITTNAPTDLTGTTVGKHVWVLSSTSLECGEVSTTGVQESEEAEELIVVPEFSECSLGGFEVEVNNNGCQYRYGGQTTADPNTGGESAATESICEEGGAVEAKASGCTLQFGGQGPLHGVKYENDGAKEPTDTRITAHEFGIKYKASGFACGLIGISSGEHSDATTLVTTTITGYKKGTPHTVENQVGIHVM